MRDVAILGRDHIKVDSLDKVLGRAKFAADYYMPDMLYGGVFRSTVPHAYIKKLNLEKARALPGVAAVLDYTAIPGKNRFGIIVKDEPCLVDDKVRRYGDAIAVVVHAAKQRAHEIAIRIQSFTAQLTPDNTAQVQRLDAALDLRSHIFLQNHILPGTGQISAQFHGVHIQDFGQQSAHGRRSGSAHGFAVNFVAVITGVVIASNRLELLCSLRIGDDSITLHALSEHGAVGVEDTPTLGAQRHGQGAVSRGRLCGLTAADELGGGQLNHACRRHQRQCGADGDAFEREGLDLGELYDATNGVHWVPPLLDWYPLKSMDTDPCCGTMPMSLALSGRFATN